MRHDDALHAAVQKTQDGGVLMVGNARDWGDPKHFGSAHHVFHFVQIHRTVLTVDHDKVIADRPKQFHEVWCIAADDGAEHNLALGQFCLRSIGTHSSPVLSVLHGWCDPSRRTPHATAARSDYSRVAHGCPAVFLPRLAPWAG